METLEQLVKDEMFPGKTPSRSLHDCFASRFDFQRPPPTPNINTNTCRGTDCSDRLGFTLQELQPPSVEAESCRAFRRSSKAVLWTLAAFFHTVQSLCFSADL